MILLRSGFLRHTVNVKPSSASATKFHGISVGQQQHYNTAVNLSVEYTFPCFAQAAIGIVLMPYNISIELYFATAAAKRTHSMPTVDRNEHRYRR